MSLKADDQWVDAARQTAAYYRSMIDAAVDQLSDSELRARPAAGVNSVAILLRHLGGNLRSRWTDFLTTDGEKPDRDRDTEFLDWDGDRASLLAYFDVGWQAMADALNLLDAPNSNASNSNVSNSNMDRTIEIRGERHTVQQAVWRSLTHLSYHVGQLVMVARMVHEGQWRWLTIAPGASDRHNQRTWGSAASRAVNETEPYVS